MTNQVQQPADAPRPAKRRRWRRWVIAFVVLLVLLGVLVALAPTIASSEAGKGMIVSRLNSEIRGKADVQKVNVGWFGHLELTGLTLTDPEGRQVLDAPSVRRSGGLWDLLRKKQVGAVVIDKPHLTLYSDRNGRISLMDMFPAAPAPTQPAPSEPMPSTGRPSEAKPSDPAEQLHKLIKLNPNLAIRDGRVQVIRETGEKIDVTGIQVAASVAPAGAAAPPAASAPSTQAAAPVIAGERLSYSLKCAVTADIPAPPPAEAPAAVEKKGDPPASEPSGPSHVELTIDTAGSIGPATGGLGIDHVTTFKNVVMTRGTQVLRPGETAIRAHAVFDQKAKSVLLSEAVVESDFLRLQTSGTVQQYDTQGRADLKGSFRADGQSITQQVRTITGRQDFNLTTDRQKEYAFHVAGPLRQPERWQSDGLSGNIAVGWQAFTMGPIQAGALNLDLKLHGDRIDIAPTSMPLNAGQVNLLGTIVLTDPQHPGKISPVLYLKEYTAVVDKIALDQAVSTEVVSHINPAAFYRPQAISGSTTIHLQDVEMPLGAAALKIGRIGKGRVDFANLSIEPRRDGVMAGLLNLLGGAAGSAGIGKVEMPGADFRMADGRIYYDDFRVKWSGLYDIKFSGSVGLDGSVDLVAGLPVTPGLVRTLIQLPPLPGAAEKIVQGLGETYIPVRIRGSRENMQMDKAGLTDSLKQAMQGLLKSPQGAVSGLQELLQGALGKDLGGLGGVLGGGASGQAPPTAPANGEKGDGSQGEGLLGALEGALGPILPGKEQPKAQSEEQPAAPRPPARPRAAPAPAPAPSAPAPRPPAPAPKPKPKPVPPASRPTVAPADPADLTTQPTPAPVAIPAPVTPATAPAAPIKPEPIPPAPASPPAPTPIPPAPSVPPPPAPATAPDVPAAAPAKSAPAARPAASRPAPAPARSTRTTEPRPASTQPAPTAAPAAKAGRKAASRPAAGPASAPATQDAQGEGTPADGNRRASVGTK